MSNSWEFCFFLIIIIIIIGGDIKGMCKTKRLHGKYLLEYQDYAPGKLRLYFVYIVDVALLIIGRNAYLFARPQEAMYGTKEY